MRQSQQKLYAASLLGAAGAAWPASLCALTDAMKTPLERALDAAWCGAAPNAVEFLGHCPACWGGAAAFFVAAALIGFAPRFTPLRPRAA